MIKHIFQSDHLQCELGQLCDSHDHNDVEYCFIVSTYFCGKTKALCTCRVFGDTRKVFQPGAPF